MELFIAPDGNDNWTGRLPAPNAEGTDGPLATVTAAQAMLRSMNNEPTVTRMRTPHHRGKLSGPVTVHLRGGRYPITKPIVFTPADSYPITFKAYEGETPIIDGGVAIEGWEETTVNGVAAWVADLPDVARGNWHCRQLFVNGKRATRPRLPKAGLVRMQTAPDMPLPASWGAGGYTKFTCAPGDVQPWKNLSDCEIVFVHFWIEERSPIASFDADTQLVTMQRESRAPLVGSFGSQLADYYVDNVFEALSEPGEWYLDRPAGKLYYIPREGESIADTDVYAPRCTQLLAFLGNAEARDYVEFIRFEGVTFRHCDWRHPSHDGAQPIGSSDGRSSSFGRRHNRGNTAAAAQAACDVPGVITFEATRHCAIEDCVIEHVGWYGVEIGDACHSVRIVGNTIRDMGAGGVKINGAAARDRTPHLVTGYHVVSDNEITQGGRTFHSAVGVLSMNAHSNTISHNHIHDLYYTGVSVGWEWGYQESVSRDNRIEKNHIHNIGQGLLSDMGGIYTLGVQPGTVLRGNHIHDVNAAHYGGWCIYPDEGSSHIVVEHNVCYNTDRTSFHQHYGRENIVRNNIWVNGGEAMFAFSKSEDHLGLTFTKNIVVTHGKPIYTGGYELGPAKMQLQADLNLFWDLSGSSVVMASTRGKQPTQWDLDSWRKDSNNDRHSIIADPKFTNVADRDLTLAADSPAYALGFEPIDISDVGPRPREQRGD